MATKMVPEKILVMRSQLGRVRGLGAAKAGVEHWWVERVTAAALVPLTLWFLISVLLHLGQPQPDIAAWAARPINTMLLLGLVVMTFHHAQLGLQVVYEDYINEKWLQNTLILATKGLAFAAGLLGVVAILKLAFAAAGPLVH